MRNALARARNVVTRTPIPRNRRSVVIRFQNTAVNATATSRAALWCQVGTPSAPGVSTWAKGGNAVHTKSASWRSAATDHHTMGVKLLDDELAVHAEGVVRGRRADLADDAEGPLLGGDEVVL